MAGLVLCGTVSAAWGQGVCDGVAPISHTALTTVEIASGLDQPLLAIAPPGDVDRIFIVEQGGKIMIHQRGDAAATNSVFLDITTLVDPPGVNPANEQGLLGLAFDPDWANNGTFYVNYTEILGGNNSCQFGGATCFTVVARYTTLDGTPNTNGDPASEVRLMRFQQPQNNHNGGLLLFGNDDFLYVFTGDGGGANDSHGACGNGQDKTNLLGKLLRIDVNGVDPGAGSAECDLIGNYGVPSSNPFVSGTPSDCDEIWAYGLRNPWRSAFDTANGDLYIADVGQNTIEEVNYTHASSTGGENYG
ncbi:MAG: PQQ-dependent sugar dehydrogenase, partial [Acidobacteriota bacterium]|nr:PQQ-dependent sugar dehydrogenase [Acidobacteriota bacterium]